MNILVTGGSGFIGTNLVSDLLRQGHRVIIYDKQKSQTYPQQCIVGDIRDKEYLTRSMRGMDAVYHLAAEHSDDVQPISLYYEVNVDGARNIVYALNKNNISRLVFTSTVAVYGYNLTEPDEDGPIRPFNDYGKSKYRAEVIFSDWCGNNSKNSLVTLRPTVIFGEKNRGNVYNLFYQLSSDRFVMVGSGSNKKSMGYVLNLTSFLTTLLNSPPGFLVYNYADKPDVSMSELIELFYISVGKKQKNKLKIPYFIGLMGGYFYDKLAKITGKTYPISSIRIKKFCANTVVNADKLKKTGFVAPYTLKTGLERMINSEF
jgi:nucleoside-diphosphate-sugar epimerase